MGKGVLERPLEMVSPGPKSIGHSTTFPKDIWKREELMSCLLRLSERVGRRARRYDYKGKRVTLTVRYADFKTFTKQATLPAATNDTGDIYRSAVIHPRYDTPQEERQAPRRLSFVPFAGRGASRSFPQPENDKKAALAKAVDAVNDKFGEHTVTHALTLDQEKGQRVISPAWRPSGVRKSDV